MSNIKDGLKGLEDTVDALATSVATLKADNKTLIEKTVETNDTLRGLAQAVIALKGDQPPADAAIDIARIQEKAAAALAQVADTDAATVAAFAALADAEDSADDAIAVEQPVVEVIEVAPVVAVDGIGLSEDAVVPTDSSFPGGEPATVVEAVEGDGSVPAVENAPAPDA